MSRFGDHVRYIRQNKRISQRDLAIAAEVDFTYISKIERGHVEPPSEKTIRRIAYHLDENPEYMLAIAGKVDMEEMRKAIAANPQVGILVRKLATGQVSDVQIEQMMWIALGLEENT